MGPKLQKEMIDYEIVHHNNLREMYNKRADDLISYESWFVNRYIRYNNTFMTESEEDYLINLRNYIDRNYNELCFLHTAQLNLGGKLKLLPYFMQHYNNFIKL